MTVETRFNIGDKFFMLHNNKVEECVVKYVSVVVTNSGIFVKYCHKETSQILLENIEDCLFEEGFWITSDKMFRTKEELLKSL